MLKVDQVDSDGARLIPLNRQRSLAQLDGKEVTFLGLTNAFYDTLIPLIVLGHAAKAQNCSIKIQ